jgi:hypothetical protein
MWKKKNAYRGWESQKKKEEKGKRPLGRQRCRCMDNIKMDHREIGWGGMDWINLGSEWGPVEGSCDHGTEPSGSINWWEVLE